jgi:predicted transcriptional regulator
MANKTESKIIKILEEIEELDSTLISSKLNLAYDTTAKYLKKMAENGILLIKTKAVCQGEKSFYSHHNPWKYVYSLKGAKK